jgi:hypothetical protein
VSGSDDGEVLVTWADFVRDGSERIAQDDAEFEAKHTRADDGKFGKGGGAAKKPAAKPKAPVQKPDAQKAEKKPKAVKPKAESPAVAPKPAKEAKPKAATKEPKPKTKPKAQKAKAETPAAIPAKPAVPATKEKAPAKPKSPSPKALKAVKSPKENKGAGMPSSRIAKLAEKMPNGRESKWKAWQSEALHDYGDKALQVVAPAMPLAAVRSLPEADRLVFGTVLHHHIRRNDVAKLAKKWGVPVKTADSHTYLANRLMEMINDEPAAQSAKKRDALPQIIRPAMVRTLAQHADLSASEQEKTRKIIETAASRAEEFNTSNQKAEKRTGV